MKADTVTPDRGQTVGVDFTAGLSGGWVNPKYKWSGSLPPAATSTENHHFVTYRNVDAVSDQSEHMTLTVTDSDGASAEAKFTLVFHMPVGHLANDPSHTRPRSGRHMGVSPDSNSIEVWDHTEDWKYFRTFDRGTEATITGVVTSELSASLTITGTRTRTGEVSIPDIGKITNALALAIGFTPGGKLSFSATTSEKITVPKDMVAYAYAGMSYEILKPRGNA